MEYKNMMTASQDLAMDQRKTTLERAFELARSGRCLSFNDIAHQLHAEKYELSQLQGPVLKKQLLILIEEATTPKKH
jgi:hypothetical protein